jgi:flagellar basal body rod protein FlgF
MQGNIEESNVDLVAESVALIDIQRRLRGVPESAGHFYRQRPQGRRRNRASKPRNHEDLSMFRGMFSAATGMGAQQLRLDVIANNLANVNTTGFKKSRGILKT